MNHPGNNADKQSRRKFVTSLAVTIAGVPFTSSLIGCNQPSQQSPKTSTPDPASQSALAKARRPLLIKSDPDRLKGRPGQGRRLAIIESDDEINSEQPNRFPLMGSNSSGVPVVYVKKMGEEKPQRLFHPRDNDKSFPATVEVYSVDGNGNEVKVLILVTVKQGTGSFLCNVDITVKDNFKLGEYQGDGHLPYKYEVKAENINQPYVSRVLILWGEAADIERPEPNEIKFNPGGFDCLNIELDRSLCEEKYCNCDKI